ncbi:MAG: DUF3160 domain-containing protein, partial [Bryobacteraceae bacterium]|nr:DUF3160 domain-containing protein [Bryobacteraceae bacterium]
MGGQWLGCLVLAAAVAASVFDRPEIRVSPSPPVSARVELAAGERALDLAIAPDSPLVALVLANPAGERRLAWWRIGAVSLENPWRLPAGASPRWVAWHPEGKTLFVAGEQGGQWTIWRATPGAEARAIYRSKRRIERLVAGPRPFVVGFDEQRQQDRIAFRLFFGLQLQTGAYRVESVTEAGSRPYRVVGPGRKPAAVSETEDWRAAGGLPAKSARPVAFHPAGHLLLWQDEKDCFQVARYEVDHWESSEPLFEGQLCGAAVAPLPNGTGLVAWQPGEPGLTVYLDRGRTRLPVANGLRLQPPIAMAPDGRGAVALAGQAIEYVPVRLPLADVVNAWMFLEDPADTARFERNGGLLRPTSYDQLHSVLEAESYGCLAQPLAVHRRPFLVTTDLFWELYAAAYQGLFILRERRQAAPAFWELVHAAGAALPAGTKLEKMFRSMEAAGRGEPRGDAEAALILRAAGRAASPVLGVEFDYAELKPRGHYASDPALDRYFRAVRYLSWATDPEQTDALTREELLALRRLPVRVREIALRWIGAYADFLAPPRSPLAWRDESFQPPGYVRHPPPQERLLVFPLGWGFDNEVLNSTVYHAGWPPEEQIKGGQGPRLVPSALDVAAALGSRFARELLAGEMAKFPPLERALDRLVARRPAAPATLYERWLDALGTQWAEDVLAAMPAAQRPLWKAKRLQTGLASWTSLRHVTVLVNERSAAECGEEGIEPILLRPPRGAVEPDPPAFEAIAGLFEETARRVESWPALAGVAPGESEEPLRQGILRRLRDSAATARRFAQIARRQNEGREPSAEEYELILDAGRFAEHHF